jgi:hypothetical protein
MAFGASLTFLAHAAFFALLFLVNPLGGADEEIAITVSVTTTELLIYRGSPIPRRRPSRLSKSACPCRKKRRRCRSRRRS